MHGGQYAEDGFSAKADEASPPSPMSAKWWLESRVKQLMLPHHDPAHTDRELDSILNTAHRSAAKLADDVPVATARSSNSGGFRCLH